MSSPALDVIVDVIPDMQPLSSFRDNPAELLQRLKTSGRPIALTVDGKAEAILQDPAEYQRLLDLLDEADAREGIRRGLADIAAGRTRPAREVFDEFREEFGIPR